MDLHDEELARQVFALCDMFEWRYLPSQLLAEDESIMDDLLTLRWLKAKMETPEEKSDV